jgi:hypothetical protein
VMRVLVSYLSLLTLPLVGASAGVVGGCADPMCTLIGCIDSLDLGFDQTIPRDYMVTVTIGARVLTADCSSAADADTSREVEVWLSDDSASVTCGTDRLVLGVTPDELSVRLDHPDGTVTQVDLRPDYEESYPNGEECDDVPCRSASVEIDVNAPAGT